MTMGMERLGDWVEVAPWKSRVILLITAYGAQANTVTGKRKLLQETESDVPIFAAWGGQWSTTARMFSPGDQEAVLALL